MNRRGFLGSLIGAAVAVQKLDIEKLLWVPGEKTIFIPPVVCDADLITWRKVRERFEIAEAAWERLRREGARDLQFLTAASWARFQ